MEDKDLAVLLLVLQKFAGSTHGETCPAAKDFTTRWTLAPAKTINSGQQEPDVLPGRAK